MKLIERVVFCDWLLALVALPAAPYNWLVKARMNFICHGDCLASPKDCESQ